MIAAGLDLQAERWELVKLAAAILQPALLIALSAGLVLASAHLITMLGTRWGRRRVSQKALAFSLLVHLSLVCGILALWPEAVSGTLYTARWQHEREPPPDAFRLLPEPAASTTRANEPQAPERPVWEQLPDPFRSREERTRPAPERSEDRVPERPDGRPVEEPALADTTPLPAPELTLPEPESPTAEPSPPVDVALPLPPPTEQAPRPDVPLPSPSRERTAASPESVAGQSPAEPLQRPQTMPDTPVSGQRPADTPPTSVAGVFDERANLQDLPDEAADVVRPGTPAEVDLPLPPTGPARAADAGTGVPLRPSVARERTPSPGSTQADAQPTPDVERFRPTVTETPPRRNESTLPPGDALATTERPQVELPPRGLPATDGPSGVPAPYRLRGTEEREAATRRYGGNAESERAVELSLKWLADNQTPDGFWDASEHGSGSTRSEGMQTFADVGKEADTGVTGLALLAFLGRGHTLNSGEYSETVARGLRWLVAQQRSDGALGGRAGVTDFAYCHAMATFALAEAYALSDRSASNWLKLPVQRAVQHCLDTMTPDGGWRYQKGQADGDMSIFGWQLMAIKSAELGGITVPKTAEDRMVQFLIARSLGTHGGLAGYRASDRPTPSMTAEALYCKQRLGISRDNPACAEAVAFLEAAPPNRAQMNYYYWYYGSLAMRQYGGDEWTRWNDRLRNLLVQEQRKSGALAGSWDPRDPWGRYGGRIYSTALATLCLEVYYRYGQDE